MTRPIILDLFCGAGGAAMGYHRAGFDVVGVDLEPQPDYPFEFHLADALGVLQWITDPVHATGKGIPGDFDAVHASPPCQGYSTMSNRWGSSVPKLIEPVRDHLLGIGLPYVIENVPGAKKALVNPIRLTGEMFGLRVHRPRLFETNFPITQPLAVPRQKDPVAIYGKNDGRRLWTRVDGSELRVANLETARAAMEMPWADWHGVKEAIPPAYTEFIGRHLLTTVNAASAA